MDANNEGALGESKNKMSKKSSVKHISSHENEEEGYMQRRINLSRKK